MSDFGKTKPTSSVKEIARQQILDLKCSVCQDVPGFLGSRKNRYVCNGCGHMVCELCKVRECICKSKSFSLKPLKYVENLMEKLSWHCCCHFKQGCQDVFDAKSLEDHQICCIYRKINCVFDNCKEQVLFKDFFDHLETCHQDLNNATKTDGKTFLVRFDSSTTIRFEVSNFIQLSKPTFSKEVWLQNVPWSIKISQQEEDKQKYLGFFLKCGINSDDTDKGQLISE